LEFLVHLVQYQETHDPHLANKLRRRHLNWENEKMNVSVPGQTMSESVATALHYLRETLGLAQFQHSEGTKEFCRNFNYTRIFDILNSRNKFCKNPQKAPINANNLDIIKQRIQELEKYTPHNSYRITLFLKYIANGL
jgi:hypothetical protein